MSRAKPALKPVLISNAGREREFSDCPQPLQVDTLISRAGEEGSGPAWSGRWEVELGFGKGKYLLAQALTRPADRFLGIELATYYYRLLSRRAARQGADNLVTVRGDALYALSALFPAAFADAVHVYFPDPWPKSRHHKRRLFEPETVDLVLGLLKPGASLWFATDFLDYGELVAEILESYPGLQITKFDHPWPDGARTNYETKFIEEGRPILRLQAQKTPQAPPLHPQANLLAATR